MFCPRLRSSAAADSACLPAPPLCLCWRLCEPSLQCFVKIITVSKVKSFTGPWQLPCKEQDSPLSTRRKWPCFKNAKGCRHRLLCDLNRWGEQPIFQSPALPAGKGEPMGVVTIFNLLLFNSPLFNVSLFCEMDLRVSGWESFWVTLNFEPGATTTFYTLPSIQAIVSWATFNTEPAV